MNLSKAKLKLIRSLDSKNARTEAGLFVAEGEKLVLDLLKTPLNCKFLAGSERWLTTNITKAAEFFIADAAIMKQISFLATPSELLGVFEIPKVQLEIDPFKDLYFCLDGIRDPGNLGTIIRTADWFGFHHIICSNDSVDAFNPKCIQASMGAIASVKIQYTDLAELLNSYSGKIPVYGTFMEGENIFSPQIIKNGLIIFGNEGAGISTSVIPYINHRLSIPSWGKKQAESLNVASSVAILAAEIRRKAI